MQKHFEFLKDISGIVSTTAEAIRLIEEFGVEIPDGIAKVPKSMLKKTTFNRYLRPWGYDREMLRRQPAALCFQAEHSNECLEFDLSPPRFEGSQGTLVAAG